MCRQFYPDNRNLSKLFSDSVEILIDPLLRVTRGTRSKWKWIFSFVVNHRENRSQSLTNYPGKKFGRGDGGREQGSLNSRKPRDGPAQRRRKTKNRRRTPPTTSNARPRFLRKKSSSGTPARLSGISRACTRTPTNPRARVPTGEQEIKERAKWKENRKGCSSILDWPPRATKMNKRNVVRSVTRRLGILFLHFHFEIEFSIE